MKKPLKTQPLKVDRVDLMDHMRRQLADSELARAHAQFTAAQANHRLLMTEIAAKYDFQAGDDYNHQTLQIVRAQRQASPPSAPAEAAERAATAKK